MAERITGHTELIGLMAYPIRHSSSPAMQNEAFAKLGYDYAYLAFEVGADEIEDAVKAIRTLKMRGSNVSMPNKTLVGQYLDELSPAAELCGAVNTIVNDNGHLTGHITDGIRIYAGSERQRYRCYRQKDDNRRCRRCCYSHRNPGGSGRCCGDRNLQP